MKVRTRKNIHVYSVKKTCLKILLFVIYRTRKRTPCWKIFVSFTSLFTSCVAVTKVSCRMRLTFRGAVSQVAATPNHVCTVLHAAFTILSHVITAVSPTNKTWPLLNYLNERKPINNSVTLPGTKQ